MKQTPKTFPITITPAAAAVTAMLLATGRWTPLVCSAVHELGHLLALTLGGTAIRGLRIDILGADIRHGECRSYTVEFIALTAGAGANLLLCLLGILLGRCELAASSLSLALFNLLPARPLDGGAAMYALLCRFFSLEVAELVSLCVGRCIAAIFGLLTGWLLLCSVGGGLWCVTLALCLLLLTSGRRA